MKYMLNLQEFTFLVETVIYRRNDNGDDDDDDVNPRDVRLLCFDFVGHGLVTQCSQSVVYHLIDHLF